MSESQKAETIDQTPPKVDEPKPDAPAPDPANVQDDDSAKGNKSEAARYRVRLREVEAERDSLAEQVGQCTGVRLNVSPRIGSAILATCGSPRSRSVRCSTTTAPPTRRRSTPRSARSSKRILRGEPRADRSRLRSKAESTHRRTWARSWADALRGEG